MKTLSVGEFKAHFSDALQMVRGGKKVGVTFGKSGQLVAILAPPDSAAGHGLKLGLLKGKAAFRARPGFKMTDEDLIAS